MNESIHYQSSNLLIQSQTELNICFRIKLFLFQEYYKLNHMITFSYLFCLGFHIFLTIFYSFTLEDNNHCEFFLLFTTAYIASMPRIWILYGYYMDMGVDIY